MVFWKLWELRFYNFDFRLWWMFLGWVWWEGKRTIHPNYNQTPSLCSLSANVHHLNSFIYFINRDNTRHVAVSIKNLLLSNELLKVPAIKCQSFCWLQNFFQITSLFFLSYNLHEWMWTNRTNKGAMAGNPECLISVPHYKSDSLFTDFILLILISD